MVDFVRDLAKSTEVVSERRIINWLGIARSKYYRWAARYGVPNRHHQLMPKGHWLLAEEVQKILYFHAHNPLEGYRRLTYMMIDQNVVATSPSTVYRVLKAHGRLDRWLRKPSKKGTGFQGPSRPHEHWHTDIAYLNLGGTFYYFCAVLDGYSRAIVHWDIRESMKEHDVQLILQRALEKYPGARPRVISDNGPQYIAKEFKEFIRITGMTHVRTSPRYPQSNGKMERFNKSLKGEAIRPGQPNTLAEAIALVERYVNHYNNERLHSAIGYVAPHDVLAGRREHILELRAQRIQQARQTRILRRSELVDLEMLPDLHRLLGAKAQG